MVLVLFRSRLHPAAGDDYHEMAAEMLATAQGMPGFIDFKSYQAEDGERLSVIRWQSLETMAQWRDHPRHKIAQQAGRESWYQSYRIEAAELVREAAFDRPGAPEAPAG
jgi:heme-degrading monooxygenase HmoA